MSLVPTSASSYQQFTAALSEIDEVVAELRRPLRNPFREFDHALSVLDKLIAELRRPPGLEDPTRQGSSKADHRCKPAVEPQPTSN